MTHFTIVIIDTVIYHHAYNVTLSFHESDQKLTLHCCHSFFLVQQITDEKSIEKCKTF